MLASLEACIAAQTRDAIPIHCPTQDLTSTTKVDALNSSPIHESTRRNNVHFQQLGAKGEDLLVLEGACHCLVTGGRIQTQRESKGNAYRNILAVYD